MTDKRANLAKKKGEVLPGIEPGLLESESRVMTITLQNRLRYVVQNLTI